VGGWERAMGWDVRKLNGTAKEREELKRKNP